MVNTKNFFSIINEKFEREIKEFFEQYYQK